MTDSKKKFVIETVGLTKIFRDFWGHQRIIAVDNLDLEILPSEVFGLLGPNGSGKSTTIKMLLGLLHITRGRARILGQLPGNVKINAEIGYLPEESYLYPFLNARETLDFYGRLFGLSRQQRRLRIESLLEMVGLSGVTHRPIGEYSKGMIRRIGLAQALINDPDLLILDEPTAGLDPIGTRQIKDLVRELGRRGKTVLLCSHLLADVEDVCDRICILYGGKAQARGTVDQMLTCCGATQITSPSLPSEALDKIENVIRTEHPDYKMEAHAPRERLEDVFLRIVSEAQAAEVETSGAMIGTGVSDFLGAGEPSADESKVVIEQLVSARQPVADDMAHAPTPPVAEGSKPQTAQHGPDRTDMARRDVLESLVDSAAAETEIIIPAEIVTDSNQPSDKDTTTHLTSDDRQGHDDSSVDRSVIDGLLKERKKDDPEESKDSP